MKGLRIYKYGEPILRKKCAQIKEVTDEVGETLAAMSRTMYESQGVGLAAPQIGLGKRLIVVDIGDGLWELMNPRIVSRRGETISLEGCLSLPGITVNVKRAKEVTVEALEKKGEKIMLEAKGLFAFALQHEIDHLDGVLIIDYLEKKEKKAVEEKLKKWLKETPKM